MIITDMDKLYINALQRLKKPEESLYKLFSTDWDYLEFQEFKGTNISSPIQKIEQAKRENPEIVKKEVLESFTGFAKDQLETQDRVSFPGGEIKAKSEEHGIEVPGNITQEALIELSSALLGSHNTKLRYGVKNPLEVKVAFYSDVFIDEDQAMENQFHTCFDPVVSTLFSKMVSAMGLSSEQILISAISDENEEKAMNKLIESELAYFKPDFIVTLGAQSTAFFIGADKKLRNCHGQLFQLNLNSDNAMISRAALMPLFSPKLLNIAPNMKKTAWEDMQKLMQKF